MSDEGPRRKYDFATEARWFAKNWGLDVEDLLAVPDWATPEPAEVLCRPRLRDRLRGALGKVAAFFSAVVFLGKGLILPVREEPDARRRRGP